MKDGGGQAGSRATRLAAAAALAIVVAWIVERLRRPDVVWHEGEGGPDPSGDREPRTPVPAAGSGAAEAPLPPPE